MNHEDRHPDRPPVVPDEPTKCQRCGGTGSLAPRIPGLLNFIACPDCAGGTLSNMKIGPDPAYDDGTNQGEPPAPVVPVDDEPRNPHPRWDSIGNLQKAYAEGLAAGRAAERAAICEWLRSDGGEQARETALTYDIPPEDQIAHEIERRSVSPAPQQGGHR